MTGVETSGLRLADGFALRPATESDAGLVAEWMSRPHVSRWWHQDWPVQWWSREIARQAAEGWSVPYLLTLDGTEFGYAEVYRVRYDVLAGYYEHDLHDRGVHVAIGDPDRIGGGIGRRLLAALADAQFAADPRCRRIVAEPDIRNERSIRAFAAAGFVRVAELELPDKAAALMMRSRVAEEVG